MDNVKSSFSFFQLSKKLLQTVTALSVALLLFAGADAFAAGKPKNSSPAEVSIQKVSINKADAETLAASLKGVGLKKAQAIVEWRKANGNFTSVDQLAEVKGIGEATIKKNRALITL